MKPVKAQAYIRQLCCLGLRQEALFLELLRALHNVIPSESNVFTGLNNKMVPAFLISEHIVPEAMDVFMNESERVFPPIMAGMAKWFTRNRIMSDPSIVYERFYQSDFYHLVLRPANQHHALQAMIRHKGIPAGSLQLFRPQNQRPFSTHDQQQFERLLSYVEHGMRARSGTDGDYVDSSQAGMIILTSAGKVVYRSESAQALLTLAAYGAWPVGQGRSTRDVEIPPAIRQICANLVQIFHGSDASPPVFSHTNGSGRFTFRAYWLQPPKINPDTDITGHYPADDALIGVTIEHQEPLRLKLLRNMQIRGLSAREQEVCLALADGLSQPAIATCLKISTQTVVTYIRRIYEKLGVKNRETLLKKLL